MQRSYSYKGGWLMNKIQQQIMEVFNLPRKYGMEHEVSNKLKNSIQLLICSLSIIADLGLEEKLNKIYLEARNK